MLEYVGFHTDRQSLLFEKLNWKESFFFPSRAQDR